MFKLHFYFQFLSYSFRDWCGQLIAQLCSISHTFETTRLNIMKGCLILLQGNGILLHMIEASIANKYNFIFIWREGRKLGHPFTLPTCTWCLRDRKEIHALIWIASRLLLRMRHIAGFRKSLNSWAKYSTCRFQTSHNCMLISKGSEGKFCQLHVTNPTVGSLLELDFFIYSPEGLIHLRNRRSGFFLSLGPWVWVTWGYRALQGLK